LRLRLQRHHRPSLCQKPARMRNVKAAKVAVAVTALAATSHAVNPVATVAPKVVADALKPVKRRVDVVHAVVVADAVVAQTALRKVKVSASVLMVKVVQQTPANQP